MINSRHCFNGEKIRKETGDKMYELNEKQNLAKERVCLALDFPEPHEAMAASAEMRELVGWNKVGKELHTAAGNNGIDIVGRLHEYGAKVFLDLKLHDTPDTARRTSYKIAMKGVDMFNIHIAGGEAMCRAALEGAYEGNEWYNSTIGKNKPKPKVIGVTVLTSLDDDDLDDVGLQGPIDELVLKRAQNGMKWGLDGIVCSPKDVNGIKMYLPDDTIYATPAIKHPSTGVMGKGQKRVMTPAAACQDSDTSILVVGSAIIKSPDMEKAAYEILQDMEPYV